MKVMAFTKVANPIKEFQRIRICNATLRKDEQESFLLAEKNTSLVKIEKVFIPLQAKYSLLLKYHHFRHQKSYKRA
jgi:hypothetical protein